MVADTECMVMRLEKEQFDNMTREFPEIKAELLEEANFRNKVRKYEEGTVKDSKDNVKIVVQKFS
jgi:CRP-like cAMP-binding protein